MLAANAWSSALQHRCAPTCSSFLAQYVPGFEQAQFSGLAPRIGIRETRRVRGIYQLTESDVLDCASFDDTMGVNGWPLELHLKGDVEFRWPKIPESRGFNHLPYRMLLPRMVENLLVAGRCASMTHEGQSAAGGGAAGASCAPPTPPCPCSR